MISCDARASKALAKVLSAKPVRPVSTMIDAARMALRTAMEDSGVLERRAVLAVASDPTNRKAYDVYVASLSAVDDACAQLLALEGHLMRARVLAQEADVAAINEAIRDGRRDTNGRSKYQPVTSESEVLVQRLKEAVPLPTDAVSLTL